MGQQHFVPAESDPAKKERFESIIGVGMCGSSRDERNAAAVPTTHVAYQPNSVWSLDHRQSPVIVTVKSFGSSSTDSG
jgi:hypothetical protein